MIHLIRRWAARKLAEIEDRDALLRMAIIAALGCETMSGRDLRHHLAEHGMKFNGPAFYQMMAGLEDRGIVWGWYEVKQINGQEIKVRTYSRTARILAK